MLDSLQKAGKDETTYRVKGIFYMDLPVVEKKAFPFSYDFVAPLYKIPEIDIAGWDFKGIENGKVNLDIKLRVINLNIFPYNFKDMKYRITLGTKKRVFTGHIPGVVNISEQDTSWMNLPVSANIGKMGGAFLEYLGAGDDLAFEFHSKLLIDAKNKAIKDSPVEMNFSGTVEDVQELATTAKEAEE